MVSSDGSRDDEDREEDTVDDEAYSTGPRRSTYTPPVATRLERARIGRAPDVPAEPPEPTSTKPSRSRRSTDPSRTSGPANVIYQLDDVAPEVPFGVPVEPFEAAPPGSRIAPASPASRGRAQRHKAAEPASDGADETLPNQRPDDAEDGSDDGPVGAPTAPHLAGYAPTVAGRRRGPDRLAAARVRRRDARHRPPLTSASRRHRRRGTTIQSERATEPDEPRAEPEPEPAPEPSDRAEPSLRRAESSRRAGRSEPEPPSRARPRSSSRMPALSSSAHVDYHDRRGASARSPPSQFAPRPASPPSRSRSTRRPSSRSWPIRGRPLVVPGFPNATRFATRSSPR